MKKRSCIALWMAMLLTLSLAGCAASEESAQQTSTSTTTTTTVGDAATTTATVVDATTHTTVSTTAHVTHTTRSKSTTTKTKGTQKPADTPPAQQDKQLTITVEKAHNNLRVYKDPKAKKYNYSLKLTANVDLKHMRLVTIDPTTSTTGDLLMNMQGLKKGESQFLLTYINDSTPNRGIVCVDMKGRASYYAIVFSGKDGSVDLERINR